MKIVVLVKAVPAENDAALTKEGNMDREKTPLILNIADLSSVEAALCLRRPVTAASIETDTVEAVSMGSPAVRPLLLDLIAAGVDRVSLISDRLLAGSDTYATALALSGALPEDADYVFTGRRAMDGETGQVPSELAAHLGWRIVTNVTSVRLTESDSGTCLNVTRRTENGEEVLSVPKKSILSFCEYSYRLRLPGILGRRKALNAEVRVLSCRDLDLKAEDAGLRGSLTRVLSTRTFSQEKRKGPRTEDVTLAGKEIAGFLKDGGTAK